MERKCELCQAVPSDVVKLENHTECEPERIDLCATCAWTIVGLLPDMREEYIREMISAREVLRSKNL
ncbi:hypothetical protein BVY04_01850 [bacterium M21]|nr:hypothetical protein BVY04_01850 [bacterium M21]